MDVVSVIIPVKNSAPWLEECLGSVLSQTYRPLEVVIFDDGSEDNSVEIINSWVSKFKNNGISALLLQGSGGSKGSGYGRNVAIANCTGKYICLLDSDDSMHATRIQRQLQACIEHPSCIVGSQFERTPADSTLRYTQWCNSLSQSQLMMHQYRECTLIQPTWFMLKSLFIKVGGYDETGPGTPEDMIFFHKHLDLGGGLYKVESPLVTYRYHENSMSKQIHRLDLAQVRLDAFERRVLAGWETFTIWSAGRDGKKFFSMLKPENKGKVVAFCDVDPKKIGTKYVNSQTHHQVPIIHFSEAKPPIVMCVALDRTNGEFEKIVAGLGFTEGVDYWQFC